MLLKLLFMAALQISAQITGHLDQTQPQLPKQLICSDWSAACFPDLLPTASVNKTVCASGCSYTSIQAAVNAIHTDAPTCGEIITVNAASTGFVTSEGDTVSLKWPSTNPCGPNTHVAIITSQLSSLPPDGTTITSANFPNMWEIDKFSTSELYSNGIYLCSNYVNGICTSGGSTSASGIVFVGLNIKATGSVPIWNLLFAGHPSATVPVSRVWCIRCAFGASSYSVGIQSAVYASVNTVSITDSMWYNTGLLQGSGGCNSYGFGYEAHDFVDYIGGPVKLVNNDMGGAPGINLLIGGSIPINGDSFQSHDIEIRKNHIHKDPTQRGTGPTSSCVKDILEFKGACHRCFVNGNLLEYSWQDDNEPDYQEGLMEDIFDIQNNYGGFSCPYCVTEDITVTNNIYRHGANGIAMEARWQSGTAQTYPASARILIAQNLMVDLSCSYNDNCGSPLFPFSNVWTFTSGCASLRPCVGPYYVDMENFYAFGTGSNGSYNTHLADEYIIAGHPTPCDSGTSHGTLQIVNWTANNVVTVTDSPSGAFESGDTSYDPMCWKLFGTFVNPQFANNVFYNLNHTGTDTCSNWWSGAGVKCPAGSASSPGTIESQLGMVSGSYATCAAGTWAANNPFACTIGGGTEHVSSNLATLNAIVAAQTIPNNSLMWGPRPSL